MMQKEIACSNGCLHCSTATATVMTKVIGYTALCGSVQMVFVQHFTTEWIAWMSTQTIHKDMCIVFTRSKENVNVVVNDF